jgi:hypothetical protein
VSDLLTSPAAPVRTDRWTLAAAAVVTLAGALHLVAALEHLGHDVRFAVFFLGVGAAQVAAGPSLRRGMAPAAAVTVLAGSVGLVLLYLYSRTIGLQVGPHADRPEDPDALGLAVVACELVAVAAVAALLPPRGRARVVNAVFAVGLGVWGLWLSGALA